MPTQQRAAAEQSEHGASEVNRGFIQPGFTLIELLVVIAIIAILASILFPVFSAVRAKARMTKCSAHQRQIYLAFMMYADDYDGLLPRGFRVEPTATAPPYCWNGLLSWPEALLPYTRTRAVFLCPEVPAMRLEPDQPMFDAGPYGMNHLYSHFGEPDSAYDPSRTVLLLDTTWRTYLASPEHRNRGHIFAGGAYNLVWWRHVSFRHRGRSNVVFLDGHAKGMTKTQLAESNPGTTDQRRWWDPQRRGANWAGGSRRSVSQGKGE